MHNLSRIITYHSKQTVGIWHSVRTIQIHVNRFFISLGFTIYLYGIMFNKYRKNRFSCTAKEQSTVQDRKRNRIPFIILCTLGQTYGSYGRDVNNCRLEFRMTGREPGRDHANMEIHESSVRGREERRKRTSEKNDRQERERVGE